MSRADMRRELRRIPLFADLSDDELLTLSSVLHRERFMPGQAICHEGEPGQSCYFVVAGEVDVVKAVGRGEQRTIATLRANDIFGQVALVDPGPRSATCRARQPTMVFRLDQADFDTLFSSGSRFAFRFQLAIARLAATQLRQANHKLNVLLESRRETTPTQRERVLAEVQELLARTDAHSGESIRWID